MRCGGTLVQWNDERGFGWIEADTGGDRLFVHISAFMPRPSAGQRPQPGVRLEFSVGVEQGKKRALQVTWRAQEQGQRGAASRSCSAHSGRAPMVHSPFSCISSGSDTFSRFSYGVLLTWLLWMLVAAALWGVPRIFWLLYTGLSVLTFMVYWQDKWAATKGQWRTPEKTLQMLALAGGWPGGVLAQQWLRHKSRKTHFQREFWLMALLNVAVVSWVLSPYGRHWLG